MSLRFFPTLLAYLWLSLPTYASSSSPPAYLYEWDIRQSKDHIEKLQKKFGKLSDGEFASAKQRAIEAQKNQDYALEIAERERLVGKAPNDLTVVLSLCLARVHLINAKEGDFSNEQNLKNEAIYVLLHSASSEERVHALLFLAASNPSHSEGNAKILADIAAVIPLPQLREKFPELASVFPFEYTGFHFDDSTTNPSVCLTFNHLIAENIQAKDFVHLTPAIDGAITLKGHEICIRGLAPGNTYRFLVKKGLQSQLGEALAKENTAEIYVPDNEARITFPNNGYVLRKGEQNLLPISTVNVSQLKIEVHRLSDRAIASFPNSLLSYPSHYYSEDKQQSVYSGTYEVIPSQEEKKYRNETVVTNIDLNAILQDIKPGIYTVMAAPDKKSLQNNAASARQWLLVTDMSLTTYKGAHGLDADVRSLAKATPLGDVQVQLISHSNEILDTQTTDKEGFAHFSPALLQGKKGNEPVLILAYNQQQKDFSLLYLTEPAFDLSDRGVSGRTVVGPLDAYLYTDRGVYRGGETVHLNALLRDTKTNKAVAEIPLTFKVIRPDGTVIAQELRKGDAQGHYAVDLPLLPQTRTGHWTIAACTDPTKEPISQISFQVEDFMPARLMVRLAAREEVWNPAKDLDVMIEARYLFGSLATNLSGKAVTQFIKHPNPFPDWKDFSFGLTEEDFIEKRVDIAFSALDDKGLASVKAEMDAEIKTTHPLLATVTATVTDPSGRQQPGNLKRLVLLQPQAIGIRPTFAESGLHASEEKAVFEVISVDRYGKLQADENLEYELSQEEIHYNWFKPKSGYGPWEYRPVFQAQSLEKGKVTTSAEAPVRLTVPLKAWGNHRLTLHNPKTGASTSVRFAKGYSSSLERSHSPHRLAVIADKSSYRAGDKVQLHITAPFDGPARLTIANQGILETQTLAVNRDKGVDVTLTTSEAWGSGAYIIVNAFRPLVDDTPSSKDNLSALMPKRAIGLTWIGIDHSDRVLNISFEAPQEIRPKQKLTIPLQVKGSSAKDIQVTVAAVDEGILQLTDYKTPSPQDYFFGKTALGVEIRDLYGRIIDPMAGRTGTLRSGGDESLLSKNLAALTKRSFKIVSLYAGQIALDAEGKGVVTLDIPEFNGQLRLMAIAYDNEHIGSHDTRVLVRDPIVIEAGLPRFLNVKDEVTLPLGIYNVSVDKAELTVRVTTTGAITLKNPQENQFKVTLEKGKEHLLTVPCRAETVGDGTVQVQVEGNNVKLEQTQDISVQSAETTDYQSEMVLVKPGETFTIDPKKFAAFYPERFTAELNLYTDIPWNLQSLLRDLSTYSYGCIEQLASRGFALLSLAHLNPENKDTHTKTIEQILRRFAEQQHPEGFFNSWPSEHSGRYSWLTAYALHFMQEAKAREIPFSPTTYKNSQQWLKHQVETLGKDPQAGQLFTAAYAIYLLSKEDKIQASDIRYFFDVFYKKLPHKFAKGFMLATLARMGDEERFTAAMDQLDAEAMPTDTSLFFGSEIRNEAGLLALLLEASQSIKSYPKLQERLATQMTTLSSRLRLTGHLSTNEQAWLVLAAKQILAVPAKEFSCTVDGQQITAQKMHHIVLSPEQQARATEVKNTTAQPLWVSLTMLGTPREPLPATHNGITLKRTLYTLKGEEANMKAIKSGDSFVIVIEGEVKEPVVGAQLLVIDRLAAGLEIDNPNLNPSQPNAKETLPWLAGLSLLNYREMRDDRFVTSFTLTSNNTKFKVAYIVRATLPGTYALPALTAEDMYAPNRHARTDLGTITIVG